jgi:NAD(P)H dehydrogenase (quinone)
MRIAVTAAGGRVGSQVVELLADDENNQVVALCRRSQPPPRGNVTVAVADYMDIRALHTALQEVDTLVFISSDGETAQLLIHHHNIVQAATDCGVRHLVALSGLDADLASPFCYAVTNGYTEQLLQRSGRAFSVARASIYTEFFMRWLTAARVSGQIRLPAADGRISLVTRADVGRCLAALAVSAPTGRHHDITGPAALDVAELAALSSHVWRTPVRYLELTPAQYHYEMAQAGEDPWWAYAFSTMFASIRQRRWGAVSRDVSLLTGSDPTSVADVLVGTPRPT